MSHFIFSGTVLNIYTPNIYGLECACLQGTGTISGIEGAADAGTNSAPFDIINVSMYFLISVPQ